VAEKAASEKSSSTKGSKSEIPALLLDSEVSCARENLNLTTLRLLLVSTPQTKKKEERSK
jgi:hypothetical protein